MRYQFQKMLKIFKRYSKKLKFKKQAKTTKRK